MHRFLYGSVFLLHGLDLSGVDGCFEVIGGVLTELLHDGVPVENDDVVFIPNLLHFFEEFFDLGFSGP